LIGALIYIGQTGDAVLGGAALFSLGLGMGAPLLVIGTSAGKLLPKSGIWMEKVKYAFGVSMLAVAIWLVSRVINPLFTQLLWALLLMASAIYMGALISHNEQTKPWQLFWKALGFSALIWGILLVVGAATGKSNLLSPLQPLISQTGNTSAASTQHKGIIFEQVKGNSGFSQRLTKATENDEILMLDLYADWCISCKEMEAITFVDDSVVAEAKNLITVQIDLTDNNEDDQALLKRFSLIGPPAILFFNSSGQELKNQRLVGYTDAVTLLDHMKQVTNQHN
jgi:thiol:disulfide interchange protein DsbD